MLFRSSPFLRLSRNWALIFLLCAAFNNAASLSSLERFGNAMWISLHLVKFKSTNGAQRYTLLISFTISLHAESIDALAVMGLPITNKFAPFNKASFGVAVLC